MLPAAALALLLPLTHLLHDPPDDGDDDDDEDADAGVMFDDASTESMLFCGRESVSEVSE